MFSSHIRPTLLRPHTITCRIYPMVLVRPKPYLMRLRHCAHMPAIALGYAASILVHLYLNADLL